LQEILPALLSYSIIKNKNGLKFMSLLQTDVISMQFTVDRDDILSVLNHVESVVEKRNTIPILANVKIECEADGIVRFQTTDMDLAIDDSTEAKVEVPGSTTIPVAMIHSVVKKIPSGAEIKLELHNDKSVTLSAGSSAFTFPSLPVDEFPNFDVVKDDIKFSINSSVLKALFARVRHAVSNEETRYYLNGVYLHADTADQVLRTVATDGHRMARAQTDLPQEAENMPGIIVPRKTVDELVKLLDDFVGDVSISISQHKVKFSVGKVVLTSKLIDGKFPDYDKVIPEGNDKALELNTKELTKSIDLVTSVSPDKTKAVKFDITSDKVTLSSSSEMLGMATGKQDIAANYNSEENMSIGFNSRYVLDSLASIEGDKVRLSLSDQNGAVVAEDTSDDSCIYVLMPMQVK
jgi:DNA polymerase-3 subunit beta